MADQPQAAPQQDQWSLLRYMQWLHENYVKPLGSAAPHDRWAWAKANPELARFLGEGVPLALSALGSRGGATMGRDAAMAHQMSRPAGPGEFPSKIMNPGVGADAVSSTMSRIYPYAMRNYSDANRSGGMVALPEEVGFWAKQTPANISDAEAAASRAPQPTGDRYLDAVRMRDFLAKRGTAEERPFRVISGDKSGGAAAFDPFDPFRRR